MALQEVCGFQDTPVYPRWNTPASLSMATGQNILQCIGWNEEEPNAVGGRDREAPLRLYIPDPENFTQNPLQAVTPPFQLCHGTTTLAFAFQGGVVAAADTRASCRGLVSSSDVQKIRPVHSRLVMTMSGSAADCTLWKCILTRELRLYHLRHRQQLTPGGAAKLLSHMLHPFKGTEVCVVAILCGWEGEGALERERGGSLGEGGVRLEEDRRKREVTSIMDRDGGKQAGRGRDTEPIRVRGTEGQAIRVNERKAGPIRGRGGETEPIRDKSRETKPVGRRRKETGPIGGGVPQVEGGDTQSLGSSSLSEGPSGRAREGRPESAAMGPRLYYVCSDGTRLQGELFSVGSGSPYAYSVLDGGVRWGMGVPEAFRLAREAVHWAAHRDAYSGNHVDLYHISAEGWTRREREDLREEYYREWEREMERVGSKGEEQEYG